MKREDFQCMRNGQIISLLQKHDNKWMRHIEYRKPHSRHAILLLHGFASSPAVYRLFYRQLAERYDAVICPLLPGHGESIEIFESTSSQEWVACAQKTCADLCQTYDKVDVLGLSMGGLLALDLSQHFPIRHLFLLAPALNLHLPVSSILTLLKGLDWLGFKRIRSKGGNLNNYQHCEITYRQLPIKIVIEMLALTQSFQFKMPDCPTDLFLGCDDAVVNSSQVAERFSKAQNVNCHFLLNSAHVLPLDSDLDAILACILSKR